MSKLANLEKLVGIEYFLKPNTQFNQFDCVEKNKPQASNNKIVDLRISDLKTIKLIELPC